MVIIKLKPDKYMGNYWGMNHYAGKALHFKHTPPKGIIYIDKILSKPEQRKVIVHEEIESYMMHNKHLSYPKAHKIANTFEQHVHTKGSQCKSCKQLEKKYHY